MRIIHCSDLHLDSRLETNLTREKARERNDEICNTFSRLVTFAIENNVRVIMICGDLFDTNRITKKTYDSVMFAISQANNIDFLYLRGNHDESKHIFGKREMPNNLRLCSDQWTDYWYGPIHIAGVELNKENATAVYSALSLSADNINIVMMHGQESTQYGQDQVCIPLLKNKHINYLALGHLHSFQSKPLDEDGEYVYCGCLEGRGFDECGEKGFVLLDIDIEDHKVNPQFIPFASRKLFDIPVNITGLRTTPQILEAMKKASSNIDSKHLVKFTLQGTYTTDTLKNLQYLSNILKDNFYFVKIKDESRLLIEKESYEHDISLKGEFIRMVMASDKSQSEKEKIIYLGIQALSGEEIML